MGARRYTPTSSRYLEADLYYNALANHNLTLNPLTANRYQFTGANPVNYVERDGHMPVQDDGSWTTVKARTSDREACADGVASACASVVTHGGNAYAAYAMGFALNSCNITPRYSLDFQYCLHFADARAQIHPHRLSLGRVLDATNVSLLLASAGCAVATAATSGPGVAACPYIYGAATATAAVASARATKKVIDRKANSIEGIDLAANMTVIFGCAQLKGPARDGCMKIAGTVGGITGLSLYVADLPKKPSIVVRQQGPMSRKGPNW